MRFPEAYRHLLIRPQVRLTLAGIGVSAVGDGISTVARSGARVDAASQNPPAE